jgi:lipopolysaccharide transport system permease protein
MTADIREMVSEQIHYRELLLQMTKRDLLLRYKQTIMGFGWALFMPLVNTIVFSIIFMRVAPVDTGLPPEQYPLFAFCGLCVWNFFASSLRFATNSLTSNPNLVTKVFFPREIFPFSSTLVSLVDFGVSTAVLLLLMLYFGVQPTWALVYLPIVLLVHILFTLGMALLLSMGNLFYRDVKYLFEIVLTLWMFISSVLYPISLVGGTTGTVMRLNPMTQIIDAYRGVFLFGTSPLTPAFAGAAVGAVVVFLGAWVVFHRAEFSFAERI